MLPRAETGIASAVCADVGVEVVRVRPLLSSWEVCSGRKEPKILPGRPDFCKLRGLAFVIKRSILLFESLLLIAADTGDGMLGVVGELQGLDRENVAGRFFDLRKLPARGASEGSSIGVNGETSG